jgi:hypothetical protein
LDIVLGKITAKLQSLMEKPKQSGFFGGGSKENPAAKEPAKCTCIISYGYVAAYANPELLLSRLDVHVLHNLSPVMKEASTLPLRINVIKAVDLIGKALHVSRLPDKKKDYRMGERDSLLEGILAYIKLTPDPKTGALRGNSELRLLGLNAAATLINLIPPINDALTKSFFTVTLPFYTLDLAPGGGAAAAAEEKKDEKEEKKDDEGGAGGAEMGVQMMTNLNSCLSSIVHMDPTVNTLLNLLANIEGPLSSRVAGERERAAASYLIALKKFVVKVVNEKCPQQESQFPKIGQRLSALLPRTMDSTLSIRQCAAENVQALLYIDQLLTNPDNPKPRQEVKLVTEIRARLAAPTLPERLQVACDLCAIVDTLVPVDELISLIFGLLATLTDPDDEAALGAATTMEALIKRQGHELTAVVAKLVGAILDKVPSLTRPDVLNVAMAGLRELAKVHFEAVISTLLQQTVPLSKQAVTCFTALAVASNVPLAEMTVKHLFHVINETTIVNGAQTPLTMTATCAMGEVIANVELKETFATFYPAVLCTLLMRLGTSTAANDKDESGKDTVKALKALLSTMGEGSILAKCEAQNVWKVVLTVNFDDGITLFTRIFSSEHPGRKRSLLQFLGHFFSQQSYEGQRITATAMLAEFVNHSDDDAELLSLLIRSALPRVADKVTKVRKQALRGLGNLLSVWCEQVAEQASSVLSALTSAFEDADPEVAGEAVASLTKIATVVAESTMAATLINICFRMRPSFDRKDENVRAAMFTLFAELCRFGEGDVENRDPNLQHNFVDQVHQNLPIFIVHSFDTSEKVREACITSFRRMSALTGSELQAVVQETNIDGEAAYDEFASKIAPLMVQIYGDRLRGYADVAVNYFGSPWMQIRGNSAMLLAYMLAAASADTRRKVNMNALTGSLLKLLKEKDDRVRLRTAKALSFLFDV